MIRLGGLICMLTLLTVSTAISRPAPIFRGELVSGERVALKDYLVPKKGTLICFWATWCGPCLVELKMIAEKMQKEPSYPLTVVTVNVDAADTSSEIRPTISQTKMPFPVILDPKREIFGRYNIGKSLPFSVLIDDRGLITSTFEGLNENLFQNINADLAKAKVILSAE